MGTKLTLYMEEELLARAKEYSEESGQSLSRMFSNYLLAVTGSGQTSESVSQKVRSLRGVVPQGSDARIEYQDYLEEKYCS